MTRRRSGSIKADLQAPRTKLLYFLYSTQEGKLKDSQGLKSRLAKALGYTSDGNFYYDLQYLQDSGFTKEESSCIAITEDGKKEFESHSNLLQGSALALIMGVALIWYYWAIRWGLLGEEGIPLFVAVLLGLAFFLFLAARRNAPKLPAEARKLLKEINTYL